MKEYKRYTKKDWQKDKHLVESYKRLAELEDKIEQGELMFINEPFIRTERLYNGDKRFIICQYDTDCFIEYGWFDNKKKAEAKLKELRGEVE